MTLHEPEIDAVGRIDRVHRALVAAGCLSPLPLGGPEQDTWTDCELAAYAEHRLGDRTDPRGLEASRRARWLSEATIESVVPPRERPAELDYWLLAGERRVGTVALGTSLSAPRHVDLWSLYIHPTERGRGHAHRALTAIRQALAEEGLGLCLSTSWTWQSALRFYMRMGFWVRAWKRDIELYVTPGVPAPQLSVHGDSATLGIELDGETVELVSARRDEGQLVFYDRPPSGRGRELFADACSTLSVGLALEGWPLVRTPEDWAREQHTEAMAPEGLAQRIVRWEGWYRSRSWRVVTPRIPGLAYAAWEG
jgi:GNAT superfamily N-acetyltransferase